MQGSGQTATLQGVSELYPIIFTKAQASADIEWGYHASSAAQIKNVDFQCDIDNRYFRYSRQYKTYGRL